MDISNFVAIFDEEAKKEIDLLKKKNRKLEEKVSTIEKENTNLKSKLRNFQDMKLGRLVVLYYNLLEKNTLFKMVAKVFYYIFYVPLKLGAYILRNFGFSSKAKKFKNVLNIIEKSKCKNVVFFLSPVAWDIPLYQRPQHIALNMAKQEVLYFFVEKAKKKEDLEEVGKNLYHLSLDNNSKLSFLKKIVSKVKEQKNFFVMTYSTELDNVTEVVNQLKKQKCKIIYEYVDEIDSGISGKPIPKHVIERFEQLVKDEENCYVVATASKLYEDVSFYRTKNFSLITNGVEYDHFNQTFEKKDLPFSLLRIFQEEKPLIGYYGALADWMDYDLIKFAAKERPDYNFLLIGVDYDGSIKNQALEEFSNIHVLPPVKYEDLPRYAYFLDVCMIPFKINDITKSTSPLKLFEYMALHKPIVTTAMPECEKYKSVLIAKSFDEFVLNVDKALKLREDSKYIKLLDKEAKENTWEKKAEDILNLISKK